LQAKEEVIFLHQIYFKLGSRSFSNKKT